MGAGTTVERYGATVTTVDVANKVIEFALKTGTTRRLTLATYSTLFTWPQIGDEIMVRYENGQWSLEGWFDTEGAYQETVSPGDTVIRSPNGVLHVVGGGDDYAITRDALLPSTKPTVTGSKGGNIALTSLLAALADLELITDATT